MRYKINTKLRLIYEENVLLEEENKVLTKEIENLKNNIHEMIPGINSNTSNSFPMLTELQIKINDYIKLLCQDIFFDVLQPNLNLEGVIFFFKTIFIKISEITFNYFSPIENIIKQTLFIDFLYEPIDNVLRKAYQSNWKIYFNEYQKMINYKNIIIEINKKLNLNSNNKIIKEFLEETSKIFFLCYICDPQILPMFYKGKEATNESTIIKSQVLGKDYILPGI